MRIPRLVVLTASALFLGLLFIILINSSLGVDRDETITDRNRPEIVGDDSAP